MASLAPILFAAPVSLIIGFSFVGTPLFRIATVLLSLVGLLLLHASLAKLTRRVERAKQPEPPQ